MITIRYLIEFITGHSYKEDIQVEEILGIDAAQLVNVAKNPVAWCMVVPCSMYVTKAHH